MGLRTTVTMMRTSVLWVPWVGGVTGLVVRWMDVTSCAVAEATTPISIQEHGSVTVSSTGAVMSHVTVAGKELKSIPANEVEAMLNWRCDKKSFKPLFG